MIGVLTGQWLRTEKSRQEKAAGMFVVGAVCVAIGWAWNPFFPINKALWTSSYVIFTGGLALQFLALCYWIIDIHGLSQVGETFRGFRPQRNCPLRSRRFNGGFAGADKGTAEEGCLGRWIYENMFASWALPMNASLAYGLHYLLCFVLV